MRERRFQASVQGRSRGGIAILVPFDPNEAWGAKDRHYVAGSIAGIRVRGALASRDGGAWLELGPSWCRYPVVGPGDEAAVVLAPEGPQVDDLAPDVQAAFVADPTARRTFESLATFYRKAFVRSIEDAKRPETRARRIAETIEALHSGRRER